MAEISPVYGDLIVKLPNYIPVGEVDRALFPRRARISNYFRGTADTYQGNYVVRCNPPSAVVQRVATRTVEGHGGRLIGTINARGELEAAPPPLPL